MPRRATSTGRARALSIVVSMTVSLGLASCGSEGADDGLAVGATTSAPGPDSSATDSSATDSSATDTSATNGADTDTSDGGGTSATSGGDAPGPPSALPDESNCAPGPGDLPDGLWFGYRSEALDDVLGFDLACWFGGAAAVEAAAADGAESPPPNDYHIRNTNETVRYLPVASPETPVDWLPGGGAVTEVTTYNQWVSERAAGYSPPVWLVIEGGEVVRITEQYLP